VFPGATGCNWGAVKSAGRASGVVAGDLLFKIQAYSTKPYNKKIIEKSFNKSYYKAKGTKRDWHPYECKKCQGGTPIYRTADE